MGECKRLRDPIYGYIDIPERYMNNIVDTAAFQRLRRIIQTSYAPLYSSAVHNRFVHSLGVYHLGELATNTLGKELEKKKLINTELIETKGKERITEVFLLACLLHDVGHAPFSHTGEYFYLINGKDYSSLHKMLIECVGDEQFEKDVPDSTNAAAPHEIMSAIVGLKEFGDFFEDSDERSLFARCITGYKYDDSKYQNQLLNCFINLLNSKVIDVDKLDYLIRDAFITGFDTVNIDYIRLLSSLTIIKKEGKIQLAYYKNAVSVIENVVYAHDAERKWIQNHPIVLYENYLLKNIISNINNEIDEEDAKLFSYNTLSKNGQKFKDDLSIKLLCDDDIIFLMKNVYQNECSEEYFERTKRRHPIWKSESEYKAFFFDVAQGGRMLENFEKALTLTAQYLTTSSDSWVINDNLIDKINSELNLLDEKKELDETTKSIQRSEKNKILKVLGFLKSYANELGVPFDFIILKASQFNSGFSKLDFSKLNIVFPSSQAEKVGAFGTVASSYSAKETLRKDFFYLFYKRDENTSVSIDKDDLSKKLLIKFL